MIIYSANGSSGYNITNSLRFRASASAYLSRTPASASNRKTWTWSAWFKRGTLGTNDALWHCYGSATNTTYFLVRYETSGALYIGNASTNFCVTTQVFRDPSSWYHLVITLDTTQATATNRLKIYVNGTQVTAFSSDNRAAQIALNSDQGINQASVHNIGRENSGVFYLDGYLAEINFIDGQALTPSSFGSTDAVTGSWIPKKYTGTYGTNGFYLPFTDNSALTTSSNVGLGRDYSGNGNYWTTNNISITTGATYDSMLDVPTLTSATVANYCTLNPTTYSAAVTLSNGNLRFTPSNSNWMRSFGTISVSSGKWYWEVTGNSSLEQMHGILLDTAVQDYAGATNWVGFASDGYGYYTAGTKWTSNSGVSYGASYTTGDVIGVALDLDAGTLTFYKNNVSQGTAFTGLSGNFVPAVAVTTNAGANSCDVNFGQQGFKYTPPTGYKALNTYNLPTPTIPKGNKYMDATTYTGDGATTKSITNTSEFRPDLIWIKGRSNTGSHLLQDSNRGFGTATKLSTNSTNAENNASADATDPIYGYITAANSNGFTVNVGTTPAQTNNNGVTYVGWQWQAGQGTNTSNTSGSITSTVSVNTTAGFSIVKYTGTGASATVGHGLGIAPKIIIYKSRSNAQNWLVNIGSITGTQGDYIYLNSTNGKANSANVLNPTSSVFGLVTSPENNQSGITFVTYCWAEIAGFSKFGSYTGNGSADGPFVYTGFRPKFLMIRRTDTAGESWRILDTSRSQYNALRELLSPDTSGAESSVADWLDIVSNGFKFRVISSGQNASGGTYIYMAFAENPFKYANAR
jgi:hypothetical protein